ncbi:MAG: DUF4349 domain-containing protein, partial [Steroidobacteraceae bacterium]
YGIAQEVTVTPFAGAAAPAAANVSQQRDNTLAYEHTISIELNKDVLPARLREIEKACVADTASNCTVLQVDLRSAEDVPSGEIRMRLARSGVEPTIELASKDGKVKGRSTRAEDLAQPIADTERQLALLTLHRDRLTELMKSKDIKIDQLIAVSRELAAVQTQIDSSSTDRANLRRRVDTELLTINLQPPLRDYAAQQTPVRDSLGQFGSMFREAIGQVITFLAFLLPWLVIIVPGLFLLRLFWRWMGRWLSRRERRAEAA